MSGEGSELKVLKLDLTSLTALSQSVGASELLNCILDKLGIEPAIILAVDDEMVTVAPGKIEKGLLVDILRFADYFNFEGKDIRKDERALRWIARKVEANLIVWVKVGKQDALAYAKL